MLNWMKKRGLFASPQREVNADAKKPQRRVMSGKYVLLYNYLDDSKFYRNPVAREDRSLMNVPFKLKDDSLDDAFLKGAQALGMIQLKGHRSVGGMRASIYNAMPIEGLQRLVEYMKDFEKRHG